MKNHFINSVLLLCLFASVNSFAQNKLTATVSINQADALELDANGEPAKVGDESKFEVKGGTPPYSGYEWEVSNEEGKTHKVTIEDSKKCTVSIYVNVEGFTDIPSLELEQKNAYPNPVTEIVNVPIPPVEKQVTLLIFNIEGRVLYKQTITVNEDIYPLSLSSCEPGKYFIQVVGKNTQTYSILKK